MQKGKYTLLVRKEILFLLILLFCSSKSNSQEKDSLIIWNKDYKLSWNDFLGKTLKSKSSNNVAAISSLGIINVISYRANQIYSYTIIPVFYRFNSSTINYSSKLLEHEQIHFDIQEIFARKIRGKFEELKMNKANYQTHYYIFNSYLDSLNIYQEQYDLDTEFSLIQKKQDFWKKIVAKKLNELDAYSAEKLYRIKK